jgi:hypothetical protein
MMLDGIPIAGVSEAVAEAVATSAMRIRLAFTAIAFNAAADDKKRDVFLLDSCATHHMVNGRAHFTTFSSTNERCHFADTDVNVAMKA